MLIMRYFISKPGRKIGMGRKIEMSRKIGIGRITIEIERDNRTIEKQSIDRQSKCNLEIQSGHENRNCGKNLRLGTIFSLIFTKKTTFLVILKDYSVKFRSQPKKKATTRLKLE